MILKRRFASGSARLFRVRVVAVIVIDGKTSRRSGTQTNKLLHGEESIVFGDAGYQGVEKYEENKDSTVQWHVAMRPGKRKALPDTECGRLDE